MNGIEGLTIELVPARTDAAIRVLSVADDPDSDARDLAYAASADPALASRLLALANSSYYGLGRRVGTVEFAVSVLGFNTVRALALTLAAGLDRPGAVPDGFWEQAAISAAAASVCAPIFRAPTPDAFCLGLLHTIGSAMLHQVRPGVQLCLPSPEDEIEFNRREFALYGVGHAAVGADVLAKWNFPAALCTMIAEHHDEPLADSAPLVRVLHAARAFADRALRQCAIDPTVAMTLTRISEGRILDYHLEAMVAKIDSQAALLLRGLTIG